MGVRPWLCHGAILLALLLAALRALLGAWNSAFHRTMDPPTHPLQTLSLISYSSLDELHSYIVQLHIFLSSHLLIDILNAIYMYGPFTICVKKAMCSNAKENQNTYIFNENFLFNQISTSRFLWTKTMEYERTLTTPDICASWFVSNMVWKRIAQGVTSI